MMVTYNQPTINGRLNVVISNIDAGAGVGQMRVLGLAGTVALIPLQKPSGTVSAGVLTFSGLPLGSATLASDTVVGADIEDSTGLVVASGLTVGPSTAFDIVMAIPTVLAGQIISLTTATITGE